MERIELVRTQKLKSHTRGYLLYKDIDLVTLELPWKENQRRISCIPDGIYTCIKHTSPTFGECIWIQDVPDRSEILIHTGNYTTDTLGCVLVGLDFADLNKDGVHDVIHSKQAMKILLNSVPDKFTLSISTL